MKKTEYEAVGNDSRLFTRPAGGAPRTLLPSTRGMTVVWDEQGTRYAYSRDGRVYLASLSDSAAKQVAGPAEQPRGAGPPPCPV